MSSIFYTDEQLLAGLAEKNSLVISEIYKRHHAIFVKWIVAAGGNTEDAEDAFQETLVVLYRKIKEQTLSLTSSLNTYLFAIGKRIWLKKINSLSKTIFEEENDKFATVQALDEGEEEKKEEIEINFQYLERAINYLGEPCSKLIKAFYIEQKSMQEIAETMDYSSAQTAKTQKYKCLNRLRKIFFDLKKNN